MSWEKIRFSRNALYEQVWSQATLVVAKSYGISNVGLAKICKRLKVPLPGRGYWARLRYGKAVRKQPLPQLLPGEPEEYVSERRAKPMLEGSQATEFEVAAASEKQVERRIVVPSELVDPHSLVVLAEKSLRHGGRDANGLLKPRKPGRLNMQVSRECLDRALGIMDALLKALEGRGYAVSVGTGEKSRTIALVLGEEIGFWIEEVLDTQVHQLTPRQLKDKEKNPWRYSRPEYDHTPSGRLALKIGAMVHEQMRRTWADAGKRKVETCLNGFIVGMIRAAERQRAERLEREREEAERQERERKRLDEERRQAEERQRAERLKQHIDDWSRSRKIREYVAEMKASALQPERWNVSTIPLPEWLEWALNYADSIDPVTPLRKDRQAVNTSEEASRPTVVDRRASE